MKDPKRDIRKIGGMPEVSMDEMDIKARYDGYGLDYERIHGQEIPGIPGSRMELLPPHIIALCIEIMTHHPNLGALMHTAREEENYDENSFYGFIGAYCGIVLEGAYDQKYLADSLLKALVDKRKGITVITDPNIITVSKDLLQ